MRQPALFFQNRDGDPTGVRVAQITTVDISLRYLVFDLMKHLQAGGYEVTGISAPGPYVPQVQASGIRCVPVSMTRRITPLRDLWSLWRLYQAMRRERFTIVHTHTPKANLLGQFAAKLAGVPVQVSTVHGLYFTPNTPLVKRLFFQIVETLSALLPEVVFLVNQEDFMTVRDLRICDPAKTRLITSATGIDIARFDRASVCENALRQRRRELGIADDALVIGFVGRLVKEKGILELLQATQTTATQIPNVRLLIIGPIDFERPDALRPNIARQYGLDEVCIFTGMREDMPELYALMDVLVLPSHREGFPRAPMEASAMGVPCIVTDIRGCREAVLSDRNGLLVPVGDAPALAAAIMDLLSDRDKARHMGLEGRRLAAERFDEQVVFEKVKAEYVRLLKEKGLAISGAGEL